MSLSFASTRRRGWFCGLAFVIAGCGQPPEIGRYQGAAMGTSVRAVYGACAEGGGIGRALTAELEAVDREMSHWREDSEISRFNVSVAVDWIPAPLTFICWMRKGCWA